MPGSKHGVDYPKCVIEKPKALADRICHGERHFSSDPSEVVFWINKNKFWVDKNLPGETSKNMLSSQKERL